jgi:hypothetical protein
MEAANDIGEMRPKDAKQYIIAHMAELIGMKKEIARIEAEVVKWELRATLAAQKGIEELRTAAEAKAGEARAKLDARRREATELLDSILRMREQLPGIAAKERSVDTDLLLAELQSALGVFEPFRETMPQEAAPSGAAPAAPAAAEASSLERRFMEERAERELAELKGNMKNPGS